MLSGLSVNHSESEMSCLAVKPVFQQQILSSLHFNAGSLPVKYLGMPRITGKLSMADCMPLIKKITARINSWTARKLSFAGRLFLIQSVLYSIQRSWSSIFILPKKAIKAIDINLTTFCGGVWKRGGEITRYLGLRSVPQKKRMAEDSKRIDDGNIFAVMKHIWAFFTQAG